MLRRSRVYCNIWNHIRNEAVIQTDGPAPEGAAVNVNAMKALQVVDEINDSFPVRIRGRDTSVNVPDRYKVNEWFALNIGVSEDALPWRTEGEPGAYRFREYAGSLDKVGRLQLEQMRKWERTDSSGEWSPDLLPPRDGYLTKMSGKTTPKPSLQTLMDRAVQEHHKLTPHTSVLEQQRDVGRYEAPHPMAGKIPVDHSMFPYIRNTEDWYEYEIAKHKLKRFQVTNVDGTEVTYKIIISAMWDHHLEPLGADLCNFIKDIGRDTIEAKLLSVRNALDALSDMDRAGAALDPELAKAFNGQLQESPFLPGTKVQYEPEEIAHLQRSYLEDLERQLVAILGRIRSVPASDPKLYNSAQSWPYMERMEPWIKMVEHWAHCRESCFSDAEMSTQKHEFRRYFRVVKVQLPFFSEEFEKRIFDIRHWLHRRCTAEFHVLYNRNLVHDAGIYPVERDPAVQPDHEYHRLLSFAFDWQSAPVGLQSTTAVEANETSLEHVAVRLGCTAHALRLANPQLNAEGKIVAGQTLIVPFSSTKRPSQKPAVPQYLELVGKDGKRSFKTWEDVATALDCEVDELQTHNPHIASDPAMYSPDSGFSEKVTQIRVPLSSTVPTAGESFATTEPVYESDTFESIARRVGCTVQALKEMNPKVDKVTAVEEVLIPASAKYPRRLTDPLLQPEAATQALFPQTVSESQHVPAHLPEKPDKAAVTFPAEYTSNSDSFPPQAMKVPGTEDWVSYTATYLDPALSIVNSPSSTFNLNPVWPVQQVPGRIDSTPYEEDQTWMMQDIPLQQTEIFHPEGYIQDMPRVNNEMFDQSLNWVAP
jgi:LysM repeat protein